VVIGFGGNDAHVAERILHERKLGLDVVEVSRGVARVPEPRRQGALRGAYWPIPRRTSDALRDGSIGRAIDETRRVLIH